MKERMGWAFAASCLVMAAAGWWCQIDRYPAFRSWPQQRFIQLHQGHTLLISVFVIPGLIGQLAGTAWLCFLTPFSMGLKAVHVALMALSVGPTFLVSGPIHGQLSRGKDEALIEKLIRTNLPRTIAWTVQAVACIPIVILLQKA